MRGRPATPAALLLALALLPVAACTGDPGPADDPVGDVAPVEDDPSGGSTAAAPESEVQIVLTLPPSEVRVFDPSATSRSERIDDLAESVGATIEGDTAEITLEESILFEFGSDELRDDAAPVLDDVAELLGELAAEDIDVTGHTDSIGDDDFNLDLSQRRADAVAAALIERGVEHETVDTDGRGEAEPVAPNETEDGEDDPEGRARNRRVEIVATGLSS